MGLNFPTLPSVGTLYPQPALPGVPQYRWDGEKWSLQSLLSKQPIWDDGSAAMNAQLTLVAPPVAPTDAAAKSYVDAGDTTAAAGKVRYDQAQALTTAQQEQARINVAAAPLDAFAQFGLQFNGGCEVDQINVGVQQTANGYNIDGWAGTRTGTWTCSWQRVADAPPGYRTSLKCAVTAGNASPAPSDIIVNNHYVEGLRIARLRWGTANAQPLSIAFWIKAHRPGLYAGAVRNFAGDRSYTFTYNVAQADTWEYKTITVPGDTAGTWLTGGVGAMIVTFTTACGSTYQTAPGAWTAGNFFSAPGAINGAQANTDTFQITGLLLLPGIELPTAARAPFTQRFYDDELRASQRYLVRLKGDVGAQPLLSGLCYTATLALFSWLFPTSMRIIPAITGTASGGLAVRNINAGTTPISSIAASQVGAQSARIDATVASGLTAGQAALLECAIVDSGLIADARM